MQSPVVEIPEGETFLAFEVPDMTPECDPCADCKTPCKDIEAYRHELLHAAASAPDIEDVGEVVESLKQAMRAHNALLTKEAEIITGGRYYESGAYRDTAAGKPQYEGYLSPLTLRRFGQYMLKHQEQSDGQMRASDNWQKGIPLQDYMDSMWRHFMDVWTMHRDETCRYTYEEMEEALCALLFNVMGYLHEELKGQQ